MSWLARFLRRRMAEDAAKEVAAHLEEKVADLVEAGMSEQEARHQAAREFGNAMLIAETSREVWSWGSLDGWLRTFATHYAGCGGTRY